MILEITIDAQPRPGTQQDTLELLLQDRDWVAAQFAAIMTSSGFGDRVIAGTLPSSWSLGRRRGTEAPRWLPQTRRPIRGAVARVRSPPARS